MAFLGVLGIIAAPREAIWANDIAYRETVYNTDFATAGVGGMRNAQTATISLAGVSGTINKAVLYWAGPMNSTDPQASAVIKVNGRTVTGVSIGLSDDNCWGFDNSQAYRADVTSLVQAQRNGAYTLTEFVHQGTNINANGASLLVFFDDNNPNNNRDIVIFDGNDSNAANPYDANGWNVHLTGINYISGHAFFQAHVSDGQIYPDAAVTLNGTIIEPAGEVFQGKSVPAANQGPAGYGSLWDIKTWDVTSLLSVGTNSITVNHTYIGQDCVSLIVAVINLPPGSAPPPPPANHPPVVTGTPEITIHTPNAIPVLAQVTDDDGNPLTYRISIDDVQVTSGSIPAGTPITSAMLGVTNAFSLGQHVVVFTASDGVSSGSFRTVVTVIDNTPPVLTLPPNIVVPADPGKNTAVVTYTVTATDDFPGVVLISLPASGNAFPIGITTVTAKAIDSSGNTTQGTFTITVTDSTPPSIHCPSDILQNTDPGTNSAVVFYTIPAADNVAGMTLTCTPPSGSVFPIGITTVVCLAKDAAGNTATCRFTVTIVDHEPPVLIVPTNMIQVADLGQCSAVVTYAVTVKDNAPGVNVVCTPPSGASFPVGVTPVVCVASDASGNGATNSFTVTIQDRENPVLTVPANRTVPTDPGRSNAVVNFTVTATDNCSTANVVCTPASGSTFPLGTTTVTCTATDAAGNTSTSSFDITVVDREPPVVIVPGNIIVPTDPGKYSAVVTFTVGVQDNVPGATVVATPGSGSTFPVGTTTAVVVGTDTSGNKATNSFTVTVVDNEKPVLNLPPNLVVVAPPGSSNAVVEYVVTATDNGPIVTIVSTPPSGSTFPVGVTVVHVTATDGSSNSTTGTFTVTVITGVMPDTQPPVIHGATNRIVGTDLGQCSAVVEFQVTVTDDQPGAVVVCIPASGSTFPKGISLVVCTATDVAGNLATNSFTVTVVDREKPALQLPGDFTVAVDAGQAGTAVSFIATATDNCSVPGVVCTPASGSFFAVGTTPVQCTATDADGNAASGTFNVTVMRRPGGGDTEPPVIHGATNRIVAADLGQCSAVVTFQVTVTDNQPGASVVCAPASGSTFAKGVTPVNCVATDAAGNQASASFTVTVVDREAPVIHVPANLTLTIASNESSAVATFSVTATDNCSTPTVVCTPASGSTFPLGTTPVQCTATDADGNAASGSFNVTVTRRTGGGDTEPPVIHGATNRIVAADLGQCSAVVTFQVTVTDNQPGASVVCTPASGSTFPKGVTPVNCVATDAAGNQASASFTVTVVDREAPVIHVPANLTLTIASNESSAVATFSATATDNCSTPTVVCTPASGSTFPLGTTTVQCTATDADGNAASGSFTVTVKRNGGGDTQPPVVESITPSKSVLWPPNHKMVPITLTVKTSDDSGKPVSCRIISVTSNEPQNGLGDGDTANDWQITGKLSVKLRAERSGTGGGRLYTIVVECTDAAGNVTLASTVVAVPHDAPTPQKQVIIRRSR